MSQAVSVDTVWSDNMHRAKYTSYVFRAKVAAKSHDTTQVMPPRTPWTHHVFDFELVSGGCVLRSLVLFPNFFVTRHI